VPRRILALFALALAFAANASGDVGHEKASVDAKIATLHARISAAGARERALSGQIESVTGRIRFLEASVSDVSAKLSVLEQDLALHQRRLDRLNELYTLQTQRYQLLKREYRVLLQRLEARLVEIYKQNRPSTVTVLMEARSLNAMFEEFAYFHAVASADKRIAIDVRESRNEVRAERAQTVTARAHLLAAMRTVSYRERQVVIARDSLLAAHHELSSARAKKLAALRATQDSKQEFVAEADALARVSARLAARIRSAQSSGGYTGTPSASGLVWPVNGPITSPFGMRWGRMHEGIDIGVPYGTPIHAAAAGRVIYCGWESGYGNLTVIDHGNGLATAYGHQSQIAVSCGQDVAQGQVIGYVGATGDATGPHLHFEVRVNGQAVDPLGYL
jgi:murein DD-endopeptidase MepM/ murein hydrolase activator NlpD